MSIKSIIYIIGAAIVSVAITAAVCLSVSNYRLHKQVAQQNEVIDSLLARRMKVVDIRLYVTDKSVNKIYGRYNKGQITMPSVKTYTLDVDSTSIK